MSTNEYQKALKDLEELNQYKHIIQDFKFLIKKGIIDKQTIDDISNYTLVNHKDLHYQYMYKFYKGNQPNMYAFICETDAVKNNPNKYELYVMDYSNPEIIHQIQDVVGKEKTKSTTTFKDVLIVLGYIWIIIGALMVVGTLASVDIISIVGIAMVSIGIFFIAMSKIIEQQAKIIKQLEDPTKE